ncbi:partial Protein-glutamate methylesterase/protein-glutamine glutaminase, partial [Patescibacteria group bacterium]
MSVPIKVLIVDDNITHRQFFVSVIEKMSDAECVGTASSEQIALRKSTVLSPDLVLLNSALLYDFELLQQFKQRNIAVILLCDTDINTLKQQLNGLQLKVLGYIDKSQMTDMIIVELVSYLQPFIELLQTKRYALLSRKSIIVSSSPMVANKVKPKGKYDLCVIGISTGGPEALDYLIPRLNEHLPCPIIIVQHMPPSFTEGLAQKLNVECRLSVSEVKGGEKLTAGHVYIAQGGKHLLVRKALDGFYLVIDDAPPVNNCKPAVDVLFHSVASVFNGRVLAIVMTGMGRDGTEGVRALKQKGCWCVVQDQASSVV